MSPRTLRDDNGNMRHVDAKCMPLAGFDAKVVDQGTDLLMLFVTPDCSPGPARLLIPPTGTAVNLGPWGGRVYSAIVIPPPGPPP